VRHARCPRNRASNGRAHARPAARAVTRGKPLRMEHGGYRGTIWRRSGCQRENTSVSLTFTGPQMSWLFEVPWRNLPGQVQGRGSNHRLQENGMPKIKHIALSTQDVDKTAKFYIDVFGMKEIAKIDSPGARGYYLSDGDLNLAILNFKNDDVAGVERGKGWSGIHHIGFQVESLEAITERLKNAGSEPREDINKALGVGQYGHRTGNVEVKYTAPDGVTVDVSETGWVGTSGL
jgi:glyoxylase I family protein